MLDAVDASAGAFEWVAPAPWHTVDFISDLHLAPGTPNTFAAWREYLLHSSADAIVILGDLFEVWVGDDARHAGFEGCGASVLREAAARRSVYFMSGNRDFLLGDEMLEACGVTALPDPTVLSAFGQRVLLTHGDAWCTGDVEYQRYRRQVRDPAWRAQVLARPLVERRAVASRMRSESERKAAAHVVAWFDVDPATALGWLRATNATTLVHGHTHHPGSDWLMPGLQRHVLSDWDLDHPGALPRAEVLRWEREGWTRLEPTAAAATDTRPWPAG